MHTNATMCTIKQRFEVTAPRFWGHVMSSELSNANIQILMSIVRKQVHPPIRLFSTSMDTLIQGQSYGPKIHTHTKSLTNLGVHRKYKNHKNLVQLSLDIVSA